MLRVAGVNSIEIIESNVSYEEYLGPNYVPSQKYTAIISNHSTPFDANIIGILNDCVMVAK